MSETSERGDALFDAFTRPPEPDTQAEAPVPPADGATAPASPPVAPAAPAAPAAADASGAGQPPPPGPAMWCSDCRSAIRTYYYALITRPLCGTCRPPYAARIARGTGPAAFARAVLWGSGAALAGSLGLALIIQFIGFGRLIAAVGIGWLVGRAIGAATADLGGRRYQLVAITLTYFAIGLGSILPVVAAVVTAGDEPPAVAHVAPSGRGPFEANAAANEMLLYEEGGDDPGPSFMAPDPAAERQAEMEAQRRRGAAEDAQARQLRAAGPARALLQLLVLMVTLPLLGMFAYGIHGAVLGMFSLGFGMLKAWRLTDEGIKLVLTGPHRVGTGPITATF